MNWLRYGLIAAIGVVSYMLFLEWNAFEEEQKAANEIVEETTFGDPSIPALERVPEPLPIPELQSDDLPTVVNKDSVEIPTTSQTKPQSQVVKVNTDTFEILIDTRGGDLVRVALPKHKAKLDEPESAFILMNRTASKTYIAQSGIVGANATDKSSLVRPQYSVASNEFNLVDGEDVLVVDLALEQTGVSLIKRYTFTRGSYLIKMEYIVDNYGDQLWRGALYGQIKRNDFDVEAEVGFGMQPYLGAAITTPKKNYDKIKFSEIEDENRKITNKGGWVAMVQHYFISAWIPDENDENTYNLKKLRSKDTYVLEFISPVKTIDPGQKSVISAHFYAGPKHIKTLEKISPFLDLTIDYSWLWFIAKPLFYGLDWIHGFVGNWGVAIMILTLMIKIVFFYPSALSYRSMAKMRKLQPLMADLKEQYGDDRQKMSSELMKVYRKEKVNPLGGCLPILLQMPVFIALYWVLMESVELRHAPFIFWIEDLSIKDPYYVLPLIMGATMFFQQKLNPTPTDPMQAKVMQMMPIFFTVLFLMFPAGLVLYWVVNNSLSIAQQWVITKQIENA